MMIRSLKNTKIRPLRVKNKAQDTSDYHSGALFAIAFYIFPVTGVIALTALV